MENNLNKFSMDFFSLKGKVAIVTGGNTGLGQGYAVALAKAGADLVIPTYDKNWDETREIIEAEGKKVVFVQADLTKKEDRENVIKTSMDSFGRIDILVNNAGITKDTLIIRMSEEDFDKVIEVNLKGAFNCLRAVSPIMVKQRSGKIINMSSVVGVIGNPGQVNYCASKAGVIGMTKSLARELGSRNINVNAIAPGFIDTDMTRVLSEEQKKAMLTQVPLKRLGATEDIANLAVFLGSDQSNYITGQVINIDGGMAM